jgi:nicotinate-nucleotide pyrophosphorylase
LGEKGKTYLPQLQKELKQVEDKIKKIELETPGLEQAYAADANSQDVNKLLNHKPAEYKNLKKSEEEYRYAIDSIEKGSLSQKYDPF